MLYRLVRTHLTPYAVPLGVLLVLQLGGTLASLYLPSLNGRIIDEGVAVGDTGFILRVGAAMLVVSLVQILATIAATRIGAQTAASLGRDVRAAVFGRVGQFSAQELSRFGAPTLISRSTNDVTQVQQVVYMFLAMMVSAPISRAASTPQSPTAPSPTTTTDEPWVTPAETAACQPVAMTSESASRAGTRAASPHRSCRESASWAPARSSSTVSTCAA